MAVTTEQPNQAVSFNPLRYSKKVLALILEKAQKEGCSPMEAEVLLLEERCERKCMCNPEQKGVQ
jgi:hypothetical protein